MNTFSSRSSRVVIREVWAHNLDSEFSILHNTLKNYSYVSVDTEYPGVIYHPIISNNDHAAHLSPSQSYSLMKTNVDATKIIQLGITLSDVNGNLPHLGTNSSYVWQFNFKDFDVDKDLSNPTSIELLKQQGINFLKNKQQGISAARFSRLFFLCFGPGRKFCNPTENLKITWVTFHGTYDIAYLLALIMQAKLPYDLDTFTRLLHYYFGISVYDLKVILKFQGLHGGLERMAEILEVERHAGKQYHQAGSNSLLTMRMFMKTKERYFSGNNFHKLNHFTYMSSDLNLNIKSKIVHPYMLMPAINTNQYYQFY
ncbi:Poly(A)-specific ribonuclease [Heracleum sosnowskyi]|uniref:poly(A)-specific ribonuclease n=1 Tax=Heracleum sosnowskyi TaxID=360622 RepID=A0AAD8HIM2_9APIA|nr:Poly(A)-specific ribonuclease [Heracleum sosnowskyi]